VLVWHKYKYKGIYVAIFCFEEEKFKGKGNL
jgi:hypothetical protein